MKQQKIQVGISACLTGQNVRHNGGHTRSRFCMEHLNDVFRFQPFCPEVAIGMGTPREAVRLVGDIARPRVVGSRNPDIDVTASLLNYSDSTARQLSHLSGFVFMKKSPSCGVFSTKVYRDNGHPFEQRRAGIFATAVQRHNPNLPIEEEGRLNDPVLRENFIQRVFVYHDWRQRVANDPTPRNIVEFHTRHKYTLMSHSQQQYRKLGRMVASAGRTSIEALAANYIKELMETLNKPAHIKSHTNVLQHLLGYLKHSVSGTVRQEIASVIDQYRCGHVHLIVPITLLKHYLSGHGNDYIRQQSYLDPYPLQLGLRNHI